MRPALAYQLATYRHARDLPTCQRLADAMPMTVAADRLHALLQRGRIPCYTEIESDGDCCTLVIFCQAPPPMVVDTIIEAGLTPHMVDFHDDERMTVATYNVKIDGHDIAVVASVRLMREVAA